MNHAKNKDELDKILKIVRHMPADVDQKTKQGLQDLIILAKEKISEAEALEENG